MEASRSGGLGVPYTNHLSNRKVPETPLQLARRVAKGKLAPRDLGFVAVRLPLFVLSLLTPRRWDNRAVALLAKASRILRYPPPAGLVERQSALKPRPQEAEKLVDKYLYRSWEAYWGGFRTLRPRGWQVNVDWDGEPHLIRALEPGRGVVLWFSSFCESVIMLRALQQKGYRIVHLSRIAHGAPSRSLVGLALLGGVSRSAENRYLADRIVIDRRLSPDSFRRLEQALSDNSCVTIRGDLSAAPGVSAALFDRPVRFAPGAPSLAWKTGATLLTVGLYRKEAGSYGIRVDPPIDVDRTVPRKTAVRRAVSIFAERLQERVEAHPEDWIGWEHDPDFWVGGAGPETSPVDRE
jgi:lauroyl/myristoyl acyltransferase